MSMSYEITKTALLTVLRNLDQMPRHEILDLAALFETVEEKFDDLTEEQPEHERVWAYADNSFTLEDTAYDVQVMQDKAALLLFALQDLNLSGGEFLDRLQRDLQKLANAKICPVVTD